MQILSALYERDKIALSSTINDTTLNVGILNLFAIDAITFPNIVVSMITTFFKFNWFMICSKIMFVASER